jgi:hypothetical protein
MWVILRPNPSGSMRRPSVGAPLLDRCDVAHHHAVRLQEQGRGARLAHYQALQNFLYQTGPEVTALVIM